MAHMTMSLVYLLMVVYMNAQFQKARVEASVVQHQKNHQRYKNSWSNKYKKFREAFPHLTPLQHQSNGNCRCTSRPSIQKRYNDAYQVLRVRVVREMINKSFTRNGKLPQFLILEYKLQITAVFKGRGLSVNKFILAQTFNDPDLCGLRLRVGQLYLLNLDDPSKRSGASFWKKGWYELYQCQYNYEWTKINASDLRFLLARSKWLIS